jgi:hypothetical protein
MMGSRDDSWLYYASEEDDDLRRKTLMHLSADAERHYFEICAAIPGSVPWDVLRCCRTLVQEGLAAEGHGRREGWFRSVRLPR